MVVAADAIAAILPARKTAADARSFPRELSFFQPELNALRLLAFLMVWVSHSLPTPAECLARGIGSACMWWIAAVKDAGSFGVCVFFFLSAYLITELLRRERELTGTIHLRSFYMRRILRIWPIYLGVLGLYGLLGLRFHGFRIEPGRLLASVLLAGNWYIAWHPAILTPMRALWSLSVEEQFYLGWPLLVRFARPFSLNSTCLALLVLGQAVLIWLAHSATRPSMLYVTAWVNSLVQFQYFALGAFMALVLQGQIPRLPAWIRALLLFASAVAMLVAAGVCGIKRAAGVHSAASLTAGYALAAVGATLLFAAVLGVNQRWIPSWAEWLGKVSFGLYVFHETGFFLADAIERRLFPHAPFASSHWVLTLAANKALSLGFTILIALLSYRYWEQPFLRLKKRFTFVPSVSPGSST